MSHSISIQALDSNLQVIWLWPSLGVCCWFLFIVAGKLIIHVWLLVVLGRVLVNRLMIHWCSIAAQFRYNTFFYVLSNFQENKSWNSKLFIPKSDSWSWISLHGSLVMEIVIIVAGNVVEVDNRTNHSWLGIWISWHSHSYVYVI